MRRNLLNVFTFFLMFILIFALGACSKKPVPAQPGFGGDGSASFGGSGTPGGPGGMDDARWRELGINSEAEKREFLERAKAFENQDIYYDYDGYTLSDPAKRVLDEKIAFLKRYAKVRVTVEGHCDERGTTEYNLALGERRANSCLQYIKNSGLQTEKLTSISYGKERPIATGHDEASWAKNRRAHFVLNY
ncbi:MAG: peptidoglycan-associated lipoprotein Pal [Desulfobacteraceae bacterium]|nr:peptidoglycan-associated lipoprotein Pal [Desulfobacteraceae bacterium]